MKRAEYFEARARYLERLMGRLPSSWAVQLFSVDPRRREDGVVCFEARVTLPTGRSVFVQQDFHLTYPTAEAAQRVVEGVREYVGGEA